MKRVAAAAPIAALCLALTLTGLLPEVGSGAGVGGASKIDGSSVSSIVTAFRRDRDGQGMAAVQLARRAMEYYCSTHEPLPLPLPDRLPPLLRKRGAVFVSAMVSGTPRCCMGTLIPREPTLAREIIACACAAVLHDKRFSPITAAELRKLRVIVSIIGECRPIGDPTSPGTASGAVDPLRDALAVRGSNGAGVVLPGETGNVETMVAWGRIRAGLRKQDKAHYFRVEAVRFVEPASR